MCDQEKPKRPLGVVNFRMRAALVLAQTLCDAAKGATALHRLSASQVVGRDPDARVVSELTAAIGMFEHAAHEVRAAEQALSKVGDKS